MTRNFALMAKSLRQVGKLFFYKIDFIRGDHRHCQQRFLLLLFLLRSVTEELAPEWSRVAEASLTPLTRLPPRSGNENCPPAP